MPRYARIHPDGHVQELLELDRNADLKALHIENYPIVKIKDDSQVRERWVWDGKKFSPPEENFVSIARQLGAFRKDKQFIGCEYNGVLIECTPESIASIASLRDGMRDGHLPEKVMFKAATAYMDVALEDVEEMLRLARQHFQKALDVEAAAMQRLREGKITSYKEGEKFIEERLPTPTHLFLPRNQHGQRMPAPDIRQKQAAERAAKE